MIFHLTVAFRVTIWSFFVSMASYLGCWKNIYICDVSIKKLTNEKKKRQTQWKKNNITQEQFHTINTVLMIPLLYVKMQNPITTKENISVTLTKACDACLKYSCTKTY